MKAATRAHLRHLTSYTDLVTPYEAIRAGFVSLALEKNRRATPVVAEARALKAAAAQADAPAELVNLSAIQPALLAAAGVSVKAAGHLQAEDKAEAIQGLVRNFLEPAGEHFVEELVFRFLLTRGDALGGSMRNLGGALAQRKLTRAIISTLRIAGVVYEWLPARGKAWVPMSDDDTDVESHLRGLSWALDNRARTLVYNLKVPLVDKNVDLCLLDCQAGDVSAEMYRTAERYIALGELKGGIDPAGADEHWKTARAALDRIREAFSERRLQPHIFFIGAAIEAAMAEEIWAHLGRGTLENAANLTNDDQIASLSNWLCSL